MFWHAPACHRPFQASERLDSPFSPCGRRGLLTGGDVLASPCVPSPVSGIRTPRVPLLPVWEKGVGGMRGKGARECRTLLISPKHSTLESAPPGYAGIALARSSTKVMISAMRRVDHWTHPLEARASRPHAAAQRYASPGCAGVPPARSATKVRTAWVRGRPARMQRCDLLPFWSSEYPDSPFSPCGRRGLGG